MKVRFLSFRITRSSQIVYDITGSIIGVDIKDRLVFELFDKIRYDEVSLEKGVLATPIAQEFIAGLLQKDPDQRSSIQSCLSHPFLLPI